MSIPIPFLVIGRGIAGLSVAFELLKRGKRVTVVGDSSFHRSATAAAVGLSSLKGQYHANKPLFAVKVDGHKFLWPWLAGIESLSGHTIPRFRSKSHEPFWSLTEYETIRERVFHRSFSGHTGGMITELDPSVQKLFSTPPLGHAIYDEDLWYDPRACLEALELAIIGLGGTIVDDRLERIFAEGLQVGADGIKNSYKSDHLILASGVYSDEILKNSGISIVKQKAVIGETIVTDKLSIGSPQIVHMGQRHLIGFGGTYRYGSSSFNVDSDGDLDRESPEPALQLDPRLSETLFSNKFSTRYTGIRGRYPDIAPGIGEIKFPNSETKFVLFSGFYKSGLQLAPLFAEKLAKYFCSSSSFLCEPQFSVSRFS